MKRPIAVGYTLADLEDAQAFGGDGEALGPARRTVTYTATEDSPSVEIDIELGEGAARCTGVRFTARPDGREIRAADLRNLPLDRLAEHALSSITATVSDGALTLNDKTEAPAKARPATRHARRAARRRVTDEQLKRCALVYQQALDAGRRPQQAVMAHFGIAQRTAGDYIARARERRFLGPALGRGKPGEKTTNPPVPQAN